MFDNLKQREIVWAKIRGFPWWPARIKKIIFDDEKEIKFKVQFFGDESHAVVNSTKIMKFTENLPKHSITKKKKLKDSIDIAKQILMKENEDSLNTNTYNEIQDNQEYNNNINNKHTKDDKLTKGKSNNINNINSDNNWFENSEDSIDKQQNSSNSDNQSKCSDSSNSSQSNDEEFDPKKISAFKENEAYKKKTLLKYKRHRSTIRIQNSHPFQKEIITKIISYLLYIVRNFEKINFEYEADFLLKILEYLQKIHLENPLKFLKSTCLGVILCYIVKNVKVENIIKKTNSVLDNFKDQILISLQNKN